MRVVIVNDYAWVNGGASKIALGSAAALAALGNEVRVFAGSGEPEPALAAAGVEFTTLRHEPYNRLSAIRGVRQGMNNRPAAAEMERLLRDCDPQATIVHVHSCRDVLSASVLAAAHRKGFKIVYTAHDYGLACPYGGFYDYRAEAVCTRIALSGLCVGARCNVGSYGRKLFTVAKAISERKNGLPKWIDAFVFVSDFSLRILRRYLLPGAIAKVIPNPVDVMKGEPASLAGRQCVFVGRLTREKDPLTFAVAAKLANVQAVFVGDGPLSDEIAMANPSAQLVGWLPPAEVYELIRSSRALVFPSRGLETLGLVVWEAMAMGVPVIASDACAGREPVEQSGGGIVFRSGSIESLATSLAAVDDAESRRALGKAAYEWYWQDPPTMERHLEKLLQLYEQILQSRGAAS